MEVEAEVTGEDLVAFPSVRDSVDLTFQVPGTERRIVASTTARPMGISWRPVEYNAEDATYAFGCEVLRLTRDTPFTEQLFPGAKLVQIGHTVVDSWSFKRTIEHLRGVAEDLPLEEIMFEFRLGHRSGYKFTFDRIPLGTFIFLFETIL
jgi:hypothetical protein